MSESSTPSSPTPVGPIALPPHGTYIIQATGVPITAPDDRAVAQLTSVPESVSAFVGAAFSPFASPQRQPRHLVPTEERVSFRILSIVEYRGDDGRLLVSTVQPSPAAFCPGLDLGSPIGALPNGEPVFRMIGEDDLPYQIRWLKDGYIVALISDLPIDRLMTLAQNVVLS